MEMGVVVVMEMMVAEEVEEEAKVVNEKMFNSKYSIYDK